MKTYQIELYVNTRCVHIVRNVDSNLRGYSKEDLIDYLWVYGYLGMRDVSFLYDNLNSWVIEEVKK